jgi:hypothetical protein
MKKKDIVIGLVILAALAGLIYWGSRRGEGEELPLPTVPSVEEKIEGAFDIEIPENVDKAELEDVSGGDASGIATRKFENGLFNHMVLADLPDPEPGEFYEGWLIKDGEVISTGKMRLAKGGYLLEFESSTDYPDYNQVVITLEKIDDENPEAHILEGSF